MAIKLSQITPNTKNPRKIKGEKLEKLKQSIEDFKQMMYARPIVVDETMTILGGNMRYTALKSLGCKEIPDEWVYKMEGLTDQQKKEFIIKDNVGFGEWDWDLLKFEFDEADLINWGLEFPIELQEEQIVQAQEDDYEEPNNLQVDVVLGDLIEFECSDGRVHRLICGDSTCSDTVAKLMNGDKADMVFTDPPYGMNAVSKSGVLKERYGTDIIGDSTTDAAKDSFNLIYSLYPDALHIWWGANYYSSCLSDSECWIVWDKNNGASDQTDCELAWSNARSVVRQFTKASEKKNRVHPTQKPIELVSWAINKFCNSAFLICDFFLGSGATIVASHQLNRKCYGMELDPKYCQVIIDRMQKLDKNIKVKINSIIYERNECHT